MRILQTVFIAVLCWGLGGMIVDVEVSIHHVERLVAERGN